MNMIFIYKNLKTALCKIKKKNSSGFIFQLNFKIKILNFKQIK